MSAPAGAPGTAAARAAAQDQGLAALEEAAERGEGLAARAAQTGAAEVTARAVGAAAPPRVDLTTITNGAITS